MAERKFKRHTIEVIVLEEFNGTDIFCMSLQEIAKEMNSGRFVGAWDVRKSEDLSEKEMAEALIDSGSEPEFFDIEYEEGD